MRLIVSASRIALSISWRWPALKASPVATGATSVRPAPDRGRRQVVEGEAGGTESEKPDATSEGARPAAARVRGPMLSHLVLTTTGPDRPGIVQRVTEVLVAQGTRRSAGMRARACEAVPASPMTAMSSSDSNSCAMPRRTIS